MIQPSSLVTDTHPLLNFFDSNTRKLSKKAKVAFEAAVSGEMTIYVPVYVMIETMQLERRGKIKLSVAVQNWFRKLFLSRNFILVPLDAAIATEYSDLDFTTDPGDALIVATARHLGLPLITNDSLIHGARPCLLYWD